MPPLTMAGIWIVLAVLPRISPKGYRLESFQSVYGLIQLVLMAALLLTSDDVWVRTHRLGGWLFVAGGLAIVITGVLAPSAYMPIVMIGIIAVSVLVPVAASYVIYRRVKGSGQRMAGLNSRTRTSFAVVWCCRNSGPDNSGGL